MATRRNFTAVVSLKYRIASLRCTMRFFPVVLPPRRSPFEGFLLHSVLLRSDAFIGGVVSVLALLPAFLSIPIAPQAHPEPSLPPPPHQKYEFCASWETHRKKKCQNERRHEKNSVGNASLYQKQQNNKTKHHNNRKTSLKRMLKSA